MCGIIATLNYRDMPVDSGLLNRMRDTMYHRGPNDAGVYVDGPVGLAHRRLSIIDLSEKGRQPMTNEDGSLVLVCNGEIYNYVELREELEKKGHRFSSTSDSEVILHQYEEDGERCLDKFNGMFAIVVWDKKKRRLFAARDRLGIKPLYYYHDADRVILASEIKAIIEDQRVPVRPDYEGIADYFFAGRPLAGKTTFKNIRELEPGHMAVVESKNEEVRIQRYWDVRYDYNYGRSLKEVEEELSALIDDSVRVHCRSDAPLGCHLSGGIDSSTIVALSSRHRKNLKAFSIKFSDDAHIDETPYAKAVASHLGVEYVEGSPTVTDVARLFPYLMWQMDIPMVSDGAFGYYSVNKLAQKAVRVTLTGHGGDEVFAGYPAQFSATYNSLDMFNLYRDPDRVRRNSPGQRLLRALRSKGPQGIYRSVMKRLKKEDASLEATWIRLHCGPLPEEDHALSRDFVRALGGYSPVDNYLEPFSRVQDAQTLDKCLYHDLTSYLPSLLHLEDRASMSVSLESRLPILDYRIIEFLATVPPEQKVPGLQSKYHLRNVASKLLPESVWQRRDKRPFPVPASFWASRSMNDMLKRLLVSSESMERGIFSPSALKEACADPDSWNIVNVELWFKVFIDRDPDWITREEP